jgi:hypothetical protein
VNRSQKPGKLSVVQLQSIVRVIHTPGLCGGSFQRVIRHRKDAQIPEITNTTI